MKRLLIAGLSLVTWCSGQAEPLVSGFARFHGESPSPEGGALLYSEMGCANCHGNSTVEISRQGPSLIDLSSRVDRDWVLNFLKDPQAMRKGSPMPDMVHGLSGDEITSIVAYLGTLGKGLNLRPARHVNAERGSALYHETGCASCHAPTPDYRGPQGAVTDIAKWAVPFPDFQAKTGLTELHHFLVKTSSYRPDGRMPHFELESQDSLDIAAHLLDFQSSDPREARRVDAWPKGNTREIEMGRRLFAERSCHACHDIPGMEPYQVTGLTGFDPSKPGCLGETAQPGLPHFSLSAKQKQSLIDFLGSTLSPPGDPADLTLSAMNCYACHDRRGKGGPTPETDGFFVGEESLGDSGRLPPPLTGIGAKLQESSLAGVLEGKNRVRPYLKTRMPCYPEHAKKLAGWLAAIDVDEDSTGLVLDSSDLEAGKKLLGNNGGVNCVTCHNWDDKKSPGIPGPDISALDQRLRPEWFREYLLNPASYRPGTLMPPLWPGGQSTVPDVLDGDTERQIAAIWLYIKEGSGVPEGYIESDGQYELVPTDRPIIQRTFFEKAGGRAVLAGFPGGIHIAYDGDRGQPALAWRGRFFDAYETWFLRKAEFQKPLGEDLVEFESPSKGSRFRGYDVDEKGNPSFQLNQEGIEFTDHYRVEEGSLIRTVSWIGDTPPQIAHPGGLIRKEQEGGNNERVFHYRWES